MSEEKIPFSDWEKIDIRVGTIVEAVPHPSADKLLVLKIDEGKEEPRQLVAGIRKHYEPEDLIGLKIVFLANLEPRPLRGILSNGMILAAVDGEDVSLLTVSRDIANNAKVQ